MAEINVNRSLVSNIEPGKLIGEASTLGIRPGEIWPERIAVSGEGFHKSHPFHNHGEFAGYVYIGLHRNLVVFND